MGSSTSTPNPSHATLPPSSDAAAQSPCNCVVGYEAFQKVQEDRDQFFTRMAEAASLLDVTNSSESFVVAKNFRLVKAIAHGCNGIVFEVKCIGEGHPQLFKDQSYVLKAIFNYGIPTNCVVTAFENEYLVSSELPPHPNINRYFCHFPDRIPQQYYDHLPAAAKKTAFDKSKNRLHACMWVVLEHHSETLEQFLKHLNSTATSQQHLQSTATITTTPWPIVHKYSRDICAALVHLFRNQTIHFDIKMNNIVISSNKEQAILIDLGCAKKFPIASDVNKEFEIEIGFLNSVSGNQSHRAPEIINGLVRYMRNPNRRSMLRCDKQPSFELGCILYELAMGGEHPLPEYPGSGGYGPSGQITFSFESEEEFPMKPPAFPKEFCNLVRSLLQCDPDKRMSLLEASDVLSNIDPPSPSELLSFYSIVVPLTSDDAVTGTLTTKAICQILCGTGTDSVDTLHDALELNPLFSPALLLLHYLKSSYSTTENEQKWGCQHQQQGITAALTGKTATFTAADVEFTRAIINKRHRATLPELILTVLWTRHISNEDDAYHNVAQLILKKVPSSAAILPQPLPPFSCFLRNVIHTRNEIMMESLSQLDLGNIDCSLNLVSDATSLFDAETNCFIRTGGKEARVIKCEYLPGLLLLFYLCCVFNDHVELHHHIPSTLLVAFSHALSYSKDSMRTLCLHVLSSIKNSRKEEIIAEWRNLATGAESTGKVVFMYFAGLWRAFCSDNHRSATHVWEKLSTLSYSHVSEELSITSRASCASSLSHLALCYESGDGVFKDPRQAVTLYQRAADAGNATGKYHLGVCYERGNGVHKDMSKAVSWWRKASKTGNTTAMCSLAACYKHGNGVAKSMDKALKRYNMALDAGNSTAMFKLGVCYENGDGVFKDIHKAVALYQRAAEGGDARAMFNLGLCYENGTGVDKDIHKAVELYQSATDAGDAQAMCNLGACYEQGEGVDKNFDKALTLYKRAADGGDAVGMCNLAECYECEGVNKNFAEAVTLYQRAANGGDARAMFNVGVCYECGAGVEKDMSEAVKMYQSASDAGNAESMCSLGVCYEKGKGVEKDMRKAVTLYQRAADVDNATGLYNLGVCYENGEGVDKDIHKAVILYQRAADAGNADAMNNLAACYHNGDGVGKDIRKAVSLYQRATDAGDTTAMCNLGRCYARGNGVQKDVHKAVSLYQRAADAGDATAMCNLADCYENGLGVDMDKSKAEELHQRAKQLNDA
ncbi:sel1 repeat family protein [Pelomyxa schiedti]|nr:sel1 repeat family protein [Pelomyxa schiedti]